MPQLALFVPSKLLFLGGCCVGLAVLVVVALSFVIAFLKKGEAENSTKPR